MCGTPSYLAPEVVLQSNREGYDHLVDSWSVGVIVFSMLTTASPFIEDENQRDLRTRIAERQVDWSALKMHNVSDAGQHFIHRLLDTRPTHRMSLSDARNHPWLKDIILPPILQQRGVASDPSYNSVAPDVSMLSSVDENDDVFRNNDQNGDTEMNHDMEHLQLDPNAMPTGASPTNQITGNGLKREGSRSLQRRSQVLSQAAEAEGPSTVPEPSWQMVQNIAQQDVNAAGPSTGAHDRGNKRIHAELSPLPEELDAEMIPLGNSNSARKKGKGSDEEAPAKPPAKAARGKGKATARHRVKEDSPSDDEEITKPRRSTRQTPQKVVRRA